MPRCMTSTSPEERSASRYLARRLKDCDLLPLEPLGEPLREGEAQVGPALGDLGEAGAHHGGLQAAAHGFDFGQFGHQPSLGFLMPLT